jgi:hypothetical protein
MVVENKTVALVCTSFGGCIAGFIQWSIPYLQFLALVISIVAGISAWLSRRRRK